MYFQSHKPLLYVSSILFLLFSICSLVKICWVFLPMELNMDEGDEVSMSCDSE